MLCILETEKNDTLSLYAVFEFVDLLRDVFVVSATLSVMCFLVVDTAENSVISPNFLVCKLCGKTQFPHSFGRFTQSYAETVPFHKISTPGNQVKLCYFPKWNFRLMWYNFLILWDNFSWFCRVSFASHKKWNLPWRISSVNETKSSGNCEFTEEILNGKLHFLCKEFYGNYFLVPVHSLFILI